MECPVVSFEMSVGLVWLWAACILKLRSMFLSCSGTCWLLGGAWFQGRYGDFWMNSYQLMFPGVRSSLVFSGFGLKPPTSSFQSYSYSSLKTSPSIQHSFQGQWAAFLGAWCPLPAIRSCFVEFAQHSNVLSMNFWGRKWSPHPTPPPSSLFHVTLWTFLGVPHCGESFHH